MIRLFFYLPLLSFIFFAASCSSEPKTYEVKGTVVLKGKVDNVRQLRGIVIHFQSTADPKLRALGEIADDGSFSLGTRIGEQSYDGVPAGQYKACLQMPVDDDTNKPRRALFHSKYLDFDKSKLLFTVPPPGEITIELDRP